MSWLRAADTNEPAAIWLAALGGSFVVYKVLSAYLAKPSAVYTLRGPDSSSWLFGNDQHIRMYRNETLAGWLREYGATFALHSFFGSRSLLVADTKAVAFILNRPADFPKVRESDRRRAWFKSPITINLHILDLFSQGSWSACPRAGLAMV